MEQQIIAGIIFLIAYLFIATEKINKTLVALVGGSLMMLLHLIDQEKAFEHIDFNVIFLLISMMIMVKIIEKTGVFEYIAIKFAKITKGNPFPLLVLFFLITAVFSAFLDNVTTVILIAPVSILIAKEMEISSFPFLISEVFASNIGGTATLIGDPPNIMIGSAANLTFLDFLVNLSPVVIINMIVIIGVLYLLFNKQLHVTRENKARIMEFDERKMIKNKTLLVKSIVVFSLVLIGFTIHGFLHLEAATIALAGASILLVISKEESEEIFKEVEWNSIFFFIGLFIMVGALVETKVISLIGRYIMNFTHNDIKFTSQIIIFFSAIFSAIVDNIPYVATMIPLVKEVGTVVGAHQILPIWWALALGACLGGNGTLVGASANVIVANFAERAGEKISFKRFLKYGVLITSITIIISYIYLMIRYF